MTTMQDAADLLRTAREALLSELLPALPDERRYAGLMIANAMAIVARECEHGAAIVARESERLRALAACIGPPSDVATADLSGLRQTISAAIRDGAFDAPERSAMMDETLVAIATERVAISNPKALGGNAWS